MKKLGLICLLLCGCNLPKTESENSRYDIGGSSWTTVEYDGHKYIKVSNGHGLQVLHSENCPCKAKP